MLLTGGTTLCATTPSWIAPFRGENATHHRRDPLPVLGLGRELCLSSPSEAVKPCPSVVFRDSPFRANPPSLLKPHQGGVDRSLIENDSVPADLLDSTGDTIP